MTDSLKSDYWTLIRTFDYLSFIKNMRVEPVMFVFSFARGLSLLVYTIGTYRIICQHVLGDENQYYDCLNPKIRDHSNYSIDFLHHVREAETRVQKANAFWRMMFQLSSAVPSIFCDTILAALGDRYGRKINILFGVVGLLIWSFPYLVLFTFKGTPLYILVIANVLASLTGYQSIVNISFYAYLADTVSDRSNLTIRMSLMLASSCASGLVTPMLSAVMMKRLTFAQCYLITYSLYALTFFLSMLLFRQVPPKLMREAALRKYAGKRGHASSGSEKTGLSELGKSSSTLKIPGAKNKDSNNNKSGLDEDFGKYGKIHRRTVTDKETVPDNETVSNKETVTDERDINDKEAVVDKQILDGRGRSDGRFFIKDNSDNSLLTDKAIISMDGLKEELLENSLEVSSKEFPISDKTNCEQRVTSDVDTDIDPRVTDNALTPSREDESTFEDQSTTGKENLKKFSITDKTQTKRNQWSFIRDLKSILKQFSILVQEIYASWKKPRPRRARAHLLVITLVYLLHMVFESGDVLSLYVQKSPFSWGPQEFGVFRTFANGLDFAVSILGVTVLRKLFKLSDTGIVVLIMSAQIVEMVITAFATSAMELYVATAVGCLYNLLIPCLKSFMAQLVEADEVGKAFSLFNIAATLSGLLSGLMYNSIYMATVSYFPGFAFLLKGCLQAICIAPMIWLHIDFKRCNKR